MDDCMRFAVTRTFSFGYTTDATFRLPDEPGRVYDEGGRLDIGGGAMNDSRNPDDPGLDVAMDALDGTAGIDAAPTGATLVKSATEPRLDANV